MMNELIRQVEFLVAEEYGRASNEHGATCHSAHEAFAVLKEELDEGREDCIAVELFTDRLWKAVKANDSNDQTLNLEAVYQKSILTACEFIQTAAMALKAAKTVSPTTPLKTLTGGN